jgi:hypothetical protein
MDFVWIRQGMDLRGGEIRMNNLAMREVNVLGSFIRIGIVIILILCTAVVNIKLLSKTAEAPQVVLYEGPAGMESAKDRVITVDGKPLFVYETAVNHNHSWSQNPKLSSTPVAYFDFSGNAEIAVQVKDITLDLFHKI